MMPWSRFFTAAVVVLFGMMAGGVSPYPVVAGIVLAGIWNHWQMGRRADTRPRSIWYGCNCTVCRA